MATILDEIIADVRKDTAMRQAHTPLSTLKERIARIAPPLTAVDRLRSVTAQQQPAIIAEIKRKSPSKGQISGIRDPASLARTYEAGGAAAISVLTEERRFGGSLADLDAVRAAVSVPLLRKDFMVEEYQFYEARAHGADIILLIAAALDGDALSRFFELTCSLGMAALVETHTKAEVDRAVALGAELIGVNVRDLKTLAIRKEHFSPVGGYIKERTSGWEKKPVIVAESGVFSATDVAVYCSAGANAVLVGEALVKSQDPARAIEEFTAAAGKTCDGQTSSGIQESAAKTMKMNAGRKPSTVHETEPSAALQNAPGPYFGDFGGRWMPEAMIAVLDELDQAFKEAKTDPKFKRRLTELNENYSGRPSLLTEAKNFSRYAGNVRIFLKREDLNHTGSHKINNVLGQALLAQRLGKKRLIAETGAGQHGVATATAAALFGMECSVYMGTQDTKRQALNVARMQLLGAEVVPVSQGSATLKDAINEALRDWISTTETTHYVLGTAAGPHPFPAMVRFFHETIGEEARAQILEKTGKLPDAVIACVGGGSNAIGIFHAFLDDRNVELYGFEAGGEGVDTGRHAATITAGRPGILHGAKSYILQDDDGQTLESHSISAGLDYPGVGPEHSYLNDIARVRYESITDVEAMDSFRLLARSEGILPAIESAHALAGALKVGRHKAKEAVTEGKDPREIAIVVNLSGRGDKDVDTAGQWFGLLKDADGQASAS